MSQHHSVVAVSGWSIFGLPTWGRSFWQDHNDGKLILLYASGDNEIDYVYSATSGLSWSTPSFAFSVDNYSVHNNFDTVMDRQGHIHCVYRWQNSGCYGVLGKDHTTGLWVPSGEIRGFITAGDSGIAKGVQASIEVTDTSLAIGAASNDISAPFPMVRIPAKDSNNYIRLFYVSNPFDDWPIEEDLDGINLSFPAGRDGGYPVFNNAGTPSFSSDNEKYGGKTLIWQADGTGFLQAHMRNGTWTDRHYPIGDTPIPGHFRPTQAWGPTMTRSHASTMLGTPSSGIVLPTFIYLVSATGTRRTNFDIYVASKEVNLDLFDQSMGAFFGRVDSSGDYSGFNVGIFGLDQLGRAPYGITYEDEIPPNALSYYNPSGVLMDVSWRNTSNQLNFYFMIYDTNGEQVISRLNCNVQGEWFGGTYSIALPPFSPGISTPAQRMLLMLPDVTNSVSGIHSFAPAGLEHTGGSGLFVVWNNFKALRHAVFQHTGITKQEIVITAGSGLDGLYRLVAWDYDRSLDVSENMKLPTFVARRVGTTVAFTGITQEEADGLTSGFYPSGMILDTGDFVTIDFNTNYIFNRFEALFSGPNLWQSEFNYSLSGSLDNLTWFNVFQQNFNWVEGNNTGSGLLLKVSSESDDLTDSAANANNFTTVFKTLHPFVARYVTLSVDSATWANNGLQQAYIHGARFYGVHSTLGFIRTGSNNFPYTIDIPQVPISVPETFRGLDEGDLPVNWRNTGNVDWIVRGSGTVNQNGYVNDYNIFAGETNGRGDGAAVRTPISGVPVGQSGTLEITVSVNEDEIAHNGSAGRTISFDMRYDLIGSGITLDENNAGDDQVIFRAITPTGTASFYYPGRYPTTQDEYCDSSFCDWFNFRTVIPTGTSTLQWIYIRGFNTPPGVFDDEGNVWLDNVAGLRLVYRPSIFGYLEGRAPNTSDSTGPSGIWGYMGVIIDNLDTPVFGWMSGSLSAGGSTNPTGSINAYLLSIPTATGSVNAFVEGKLADNIAAFIEGGVNSSGAINAYMVSSGAISSIFAYMGTMISESINAYLLAPSGTMSAINGYLITPEISVINGYISGPGTGNTTINAYLNANGYQSSIYGYVLCSGQPSGSINGYLFNNGTSSNINAYMSCGVSSGINAYMYGAAVSTGVINAWISGVGHQVSAINAYLMGISGSISGSINCYMNAHLFEDGMIYSHMIGFDDPDACDFPLSTLPSFTIPTGNFYQ